MLDPKRPFTVYKSNRKLAKQQQMQWQDTLEYSPNLTLNNVPLASTMIRWRVKNPQGGPTAEPVGYLKMTWYVTFRGQRMSTATPNQVNADGQLQPK